MTQVCAAEVPWHDQVGSGTEGTSDLTGTVGFHCGQTEDQGKGYVILEDFLMEVGLEKTLTISTEGQGGCSSHGEGSEKCLEVGGKA